MLILGVCAQALSSSYQTLLCLSLRVLIAMNGLAFVSFVLTLSATKYTTLDMCVAAVRESGK